MITIIHLKSTTNTWKIVTSVVFILSESSWYNQSFNSHDGTGSRCNNLDESSDIIFTVPQISYIPQHRLVRIDIDGYTNRACAYCKILGNKTNRGWPLKSYFMCEACSVPLCKPQDRNCFDSYHELLSRNPNIANFAKKVKQSVFIKQ